MPFIRPLLAALRCMFRSRPAVELEILARRHQIGVVQHANKRTRLTPAARFVVGVSFPKLGGLALCTGCRQARDGDRLVPQTVSRVLDLEGSAGESGPPPSRFARASRFGWRGTRTSNRNQEPDRMPSGDGCFNDCIGCVPLMRGMPSTSTGEADTALSPSITGIDRRATVWRSLEPANLSL